MDELTRERYGPVPAHERSLPTRALFRARRKALCGMEEIPRPREKGVRDRRLVEVLKRWKP